MKAAVYLRVSTAKQTVENQRPDLERYVSAQGWDALWFEETGHGDDDTRPAWEQVMGLARRREVGAVVVWRMDRCSRSLQHMLEVFEAMDRARVELHVVKQPGLGTADSATARFVRNLLAAVAEFELETIRERTREGVHRAWAAGKRKGRPPVGQGKGDVRQGGAVVLDRMRMLVEAGQSWAQAAKTCGVSRSTAKRLRKAAAASEVQP